MKCRGGTAKQGMESHPPFPYTIEIGEAKQRSDLGRKRVLQVESGKNRGRILVRRKPALTMAPDNNSSSVVNKSSFSSDSEFDTDTVASPVPEELEVCSSFSRIMVLTKRINEVKDEAFLVLIFLAGYAEEYVEFWGAFFGKELKLNLKEAEAVGTELVAVLEMALELCLDHIKLASNKSVGEFLKPSASEFVEIVDYFRRYAQMMNRLVARVIPEKTSEKLELICHLQHKVEVDCNLLNGTIEGAFKDHKRLTVDNHVAWGDLHVDQFLDDSIQKVEEFLDDSICKANVKNIPVLLKNVRHRGEDSLETQMSMALQLQHLDSSHITRLIGHSENKDGKILILEHMDGDLSTLECKKPQLSLPVVIDIMIQAAKGMKHLHQNRINHTGGWLYPSTIFFKGRTDGRYLIKIAHFATDQRGDFQHFRDEDDISRFNLFTRLHSDIPQNLMELLDSCTVRDRSQCTSFENIYEQLWIVMEEILTGATNLKQGLKLENSNTAGKNVISRSGLQEDTLTKTAEPLESNANLPWTVVNALIYIEEMRCFEKKHVAFTHHMSSLEAEVHHIRCFGKKKAFMQQLDSLPLFFTEIELVVRQHGQVPDSLQSWLDEVENCLEELLNLIVFPQPAKENHFLNLMSRYKQKRTILAKRAELDELIKMGKYWGEILAKHEIYEPHELSRK